MLFLGHFMANIFIVLSKLNDGTDKFALWESQLELDEFFVRVGPSITLPRPDCSVPLPSSFYRSD